MGVRLFSDTCPRAGGGDASCRTYSHRYDGRCQWRSQESFTFFRRYFDTVTAAEITWQPWTTMLEGVRDQFAGTREASRFRLLLEGMICLAWFLGERFLR